MEFTIKPKPQDYDCRVIKRYLLFPRKFKNKIVWLETVYIEQRYMIYKPIPGTIYQKHIRFPRWFSIRLTDEEAYKRYKKKNEDAMK